MASKRKESRVPDSSCLQVRNTCRVGTSKRVSLPNFILAFTTFISLLNLFQGVSAVL
jgi:hypothetical protein